MIYIEDNYDLKTWGNAFAGTTSVGDVIVISSNKVLKDMDGAFPKLGNVNGGIDVKRNEAMTSMKDAFPKLIKTGNSIMITYNYKLANMKGSFALLETPGRNGLKFDYVGIVNFDDAFPSLQYTGYKNNDNKPDGSGIVIEHCDAMTSMKNAFPELIWAPKIEMKHIHALETMEGSFAKLEEIGMFEMGQIWELPALPQLLDGLKYWGTHFNMAYMFKLTVRRAWVSACNFVHERILYDLIPVGRYLLGLKPKRWMIQ
jgi:hypothetical protein